MITGRDIRDAAGIIADAIKAHGESIRKGLEAQKR